VQSRIRVAGDTVRVGGAGLEADVIAIRADRLSTAPGATIAARLPFDNLAGIDDSVPALTLELTPEAFTLPFPFGQNGGSEIAINVGGRSWGSRTLPLDSGYITVLPRGGAAGATAVVLSGPLTTAGYRFFFDGAGKDGEIPVFYNGVLPATPQVSGSISATVAVSEGARKERFDDSVRTENVAVRLRAGVIAEVGPGPARHRGQRRRAHARHLPALCHPRLRGRELTMPRLPLFSLRRRAWLALAGAAWAAWRPARAAVAEGPEPPRVALLLGNREYPDGEDLPPIHKNVRDLRGALERLGFAVEQGLDLDAAAARSALAAFAERVRDLPADATVLVYFSGHGAQVDAENLLVGARQSPKARPAVLARGSVALGNEVLGFLPLRPAGLTIAIVDACRTSLAAALQGDGLNQVEAPPGCLIAFATGAGKPAIAPADDTRNTFYTGSLVKLLGTASGEITFSDLFRLVKTDVQDTMLNHPVALLRRFTQYPFIAENTQVQRRLAPRTVGDRVAGHALPRRRGGRAVGARGGRRVAGRRGAAGGRVHGALPAECARRQRPGGARRRQRSGADPAPQRRAPVPQRLRRRRRASRAQPRPAEGRPRRQGRRGRAWAACTRPAASAPTTAATKAGCSTRRRWATASPATSWRCTTRRFRQPLVASQYEGRARELGYTPPPSLDNTRK
jgi:hypothetical protein